MLDQRVYVDVALGFAAVLILASLGNKLGDMMFRRGLAKPFHVRGHRIHHRDVLLLAFPAAYTLVASLILLGFVQVVWSAFWTGIETTFFIAAGCLLLDATMDTVSSAMRERAVLHHEFVYLLIPAYVFTHLVTVLA